MATVVLVARLVVAVVFAVAGVGKLMDLQGSRRAMAEFGLPKRLARDAGTVLPFAELAAAAALLPQPSARWGALAALLLLGAFVGGMVNSLARGEAPDCHCFGQIASSKVSGWTVARNVLLAAVAALVLVDAPGRSLTGWSGSHAAADAIAVVALALAAVLGAVVLALRAQRRLLLKSLGEERSDTLRLPRAGLPLGTRAPDFELPTVSGQTVSRASLCARGLPVLLVFTSPSCAPCHALLPHLARWQAALADRITIAVLSNGAGTEEAGAGSGPAIDGIPVLLQEGQEVADAFRVRATPTATMLAPNGRVAGPKATGAPEIEALVRVTLRGSAASSAVPGVLLPA